MCLDKGHRLYSPLMHALFVRHAAVPIKKTADSSALTLDYNIYLRNRVSSSFYKVAESACFLFNLIQPIFEFNQHHLLTIYMYEYYSRILCKVHGNFLLKITYFYDKKWWSFDYYYNCIVN
jgi:hypothetical protein